MKMDGYDVEKQWDVGHPIVTTYRVYTWKHENNRTIKHYRNGYSDYKSMITAHPELKR